MRIHMKKNSLILNWIPEIILAAETIFYWTSSSLTNPVAIILLMALITVFILKKKLLGRTIALLFLLLNLYMCLALWPELSEFPYWSEAAIEMLLIGVSIFVFGISSSILMIIKWTKTIEF